MLINNNYSVTALRTNKHCTPGEYPSKPIDLVLAIWKRFDHWLNSIKRNPVNLPEMRPELFDDGELIVNRCLELWDRFYEEWIYRDAIMIPYHDLLRNPEAALERYGGANRWHRTSNEWNNQGPDKLPEWRREMYLA